MQQFAFPREESVTSLAAADVPRPSVGVKTAAFSLCLTFFLSLPSAPVSGTDTR